MFNKTTFRIMAKSKNGGSRAYIRGRIGSDVYSIGKNGKGEKQQVVRSLAETVANPRTAAQMAGRMYMSTVMQAVASMAFIVDHSFDGFSKGQPSISEFIRRNYALVKADAVAHPASGQSFGLNKYQEKGMKKGKWVISAGSAIFPSGVSTTSDFKNLSVAVGETPTYGTLKAAWGLTTDEYITLISFKEGTNYENDGVVTPLYARLRIKESLNEETVLTADNAAAAFDIEGNIGLLCTLSGGNLSIHLNVSDESVFYGSDWAIITRKENGSFIHNTVQITTTGGVFASDVALPTYPTGSEAFLNGGDL